MAALAALPLLASCGGETAEAPIVVERLSGANAAPRPAVAAGTLARIADGREAQRRLGYVNVAAVKALGPAIDASRVERLILGAGASRLRSASPTPLTATQIGDATVLDRADARRVIGGSPALRDALEETTPKPNLIEDETPSAIQSCLGDPAAQTVVGPTVLGTKSAIGVSLIDSQDAPAGPKLLICAAPHFFRDLHRVETRLGRLFPSTGLATADRPVIGEQEIGERDIMAGAVALDQIDDALLDDLLAGGPRLVALGAAGAAGGPGADSGPH